VTADNGVPTTASAHEGQSGDLRERVAEAMHAKVRVFWGDGPWDALPDTLRENYRAAADAVIPLVAQAQRDADVAAMEQRPGQGRGRGAMYIRTLPLITEEITRG
jgi:hypothetical protein